MGYCIPMSTLLTDSNTKLKKGEAKGFRTFALHLAPHKLGGKNICLGASPGCISSCLNTAGMGVYKTVQEARIKKTKQFHLDNVEFLKILIKEVSNKLKTAKRKGYNVAFRLNTTSDFPWETVKLEGKNIMEHFPQVNFYDYTKIPRRALDFLAGKLPSNYHLTFSKSENNDSHCKIISACGGNIAVVFSGKLPETYLGKKVINGDVDDLRFLDQNNCIVGLLAKGRAKQDKSGFVVHV